MLSWPRIALRCAFATVLTASSISASVRVSYRCRGFLTREVTVGNGPGRKVPLCTGRAAFLQAKVRTRATNCAERPAPTQSGFAVEESRLCKNWSIYQIANGYKFNHDDILLAWEAMKARPSASRALELGAGTGSVGLLWLGQQSLDAALIQLEAQEDSVELLRRSLVLNGLEERVTVHLGDLRDPGALNAIAGKFEVVMANPPYLDPADPLVWKLPAHPQRRFCYYELRGGLTDFVSAAAEKLAVDGVFCMVHQISRRDDALDALMRGGFVVKRQLTVLSRGQARWVILVCQKDTSRSSITQSPEQDQLSVREVDGQWSDEWVAVCKQMGTFQKPQA